MFERHVGGDSAILVSLMNGEPEATEATAELAELARSAGVSPLAVILGRSQRPDAATYAGSGKVEEILRLAKEHFDLDAFWPGKADAGQ